MSEVAQLIVALIAALPQDIAAIRTLYDTVSADWAQTDKDAVEKALDAAKAQDDADTAAMNEE